MLKGKADEKESMAHVVKMGSTHLPPLCLFMARHTSTHAQRDWVVDSSVSAHMCRERNLFNLHCPLRPPPLATPGNGKTVSTPDAGDTLNWAPMPSITGNCTLHETFTKNKLLVRKSQMLEHRVSRDIPNANCFGDGSSHHKTVQLQLNKPQSNRLDGKNQRLTTTSTNGLSHLTIDDVHPSAVEAEGLACGTGLQHNKSCSNLPGEMRAPMSAMEGPDGLTTHAPALNHRGKAVNRSVNASVPSD